MKNVYNDHVVPLRTGQMQMKTRSASSWREGSAARRDSDADDHHVSDLMGYKELRNVIFRERGLQPAGTCFL